MNKLEDYFFNRSEKTIHKWHHYFDIYDKHFSKFIGKSPTVLEIGVWNGGSLLMWKDYFGKDSKIIGIDINQDCKNHENLEKNINVHILNQYNDNDLDFLISNYKNFDIIIDDGSHINPHMIHSFNKLFNYVTDGGVYLIEDVHTSYWDIFQGGLRNENTIIEHSKKIIDSINGHHWENGVDDYTKSVNSISFYDSIIVFDKKIKHNTPIDSARNNGKQVDVISGRIIE